MQLDFAVIGGTGLYALDELIDVERQSYDTRYGAPSDALTIGTWQNKRVAFLARHGSAHTIAPHRVNYRANIAALKAAGVSHVVAVNAVGGITHGPCVLVVCDQLIDYTAGRLSSFSDFEAEKVEHIDLSEPYSQALRQALIAAAARANVAVQTQGCYACTQGPRLETRAEIAKLKRDGNDVVGMTAMPEAALAREAGLQYASLSVVANWAAGCGDQAEITMQEIYDNLKQGMQLVRKVLAQLSMNAP
jgi:5'-methylthioinosine phosphorylase